MITRQLLRDRRRGLLGWSVGTILAIAATVALWPTVDGSPEFERVFEELPAGVRAIIGSQADIALTSAAGYLQARLFSTLLPILLVVYGIGLGAAAIGGSEEDGTLQLVATAPVSRSRLAVQRLVGSAGLLVGLSLVGLVTTVALSAPVGLLREVPPARIAVATWAVLCLGLLHGAIAYAVGSATGRRAPAVTAATAIAVAGYVLNAVAASSASLESLRVVSPWWWHLDRNLLVHDATVYSTVLPLAIAMGLCAAGVLRFARRDLRLP